MQTPRDILIKLIPSTYSAMFIIIIIATYKLITLLLYEVISGKLSRNCQNYSNK